jgi:hypothetical protein
LNEGRPRTHADLALRWKPSVRTGWLHVLLSHGCESAARCRSPATYLTREPEGAAETAEGDWDGC